MTHHESLSQCPGDPEHHVWRGLGHLASPSTDGSHQWSEMAVVVTAPARWVPGEDRLIVNPHGLRDATRAMSWLTYQGDMRGLVYSPHDESPEMMAIFDSYGATHTTMRDRLGWRRGSLMCLIFLRDGTIIDADGMISTSHPIEDILEDRWASFLRLMYRPIVPVLQVGHGL